MLKKSFIKQLQVGSTISAATQIGPADTAGYYYLPLEY